MRSGSSEQQVLGVEILRVLERPAGQAHRGRAAAAARRPASRSSMRSAGAARATSAAADTKSEQAINNHRFPEVSVRFMPV